MLKGLLAGLWRGAPRVVRRACVWVAQPRFTVTAGAVVCDEGGRVLLLRHVLRAGSGWGIPGGFLRAGEQPEEAVRREVREETGLELESVEIDRAEWFALSGLPEALSRDQRRVIGRALAAGAKTAE